MIFSVTGNLTPHFSVCLLYSIFAKRNAFTKRQMKLQSRASLVHRCLPGQRVFVKAICFCEIWKNKTFQLMSLSTQTSQPQFSSYQVPVWRLGKRDVELSLEVHIFGFRGTYLCVLEAGFLFIFSYASCPNVADGLQYIPTAHCAESPDSHDKAARAGCTLLCGCEEKHDVTVWNQRLVCGKFFRLSDR